MLNSVIKYMHMRRQENRVKMRNCVSLNIGRNLHKTIFIDVIIKTVIIFLGISTTAQASNIHDIISIDTNSLDTAKILIRYFEQMSVPKPFILRTGQEFEKHRQYLRKKILSITRLWPLPERVDLKVQQSEVLDHPWCTVRRVYYQIWPNVYGNGLLYMPRNFSEKPAPGMLCPHGHWPGDSAYPVVQQRCLVFAKIGYVVFAPYVPHYEDLPLGISYATVQIWSMMRALDYLETLPEVDKTRIGCCGGSGGGMQTEYLLALDNRIKAAGIVGYTTSFRTLVLPDRCHCPCNHLPGLLRYTDHPEMSVLGLPTPVQYLTMNDFTRRFKQDYFPLIQRLYASYGVEDHVDCRHWPTPHSYDKPKREQNYWWMEKWLRGDTTEQVIPEPNVEVFPPEKLTALTVEVKDNKGYSEISNVYRKQRGYRMEKIVNKSDWFAYRKSMVKNLCDLLGEDVKLPSQTTVAEKTREHADQTLVVEQWIYPSEGGIRIPAKLLHRQNTSGKLPVVLICSNGQKDDPGEKKVEQLAKQLAMDGALVVLPQVRFTGEYSLAGMKNLSIPDPCDNDPVAPAFISAVPMATNSPWLSPSGSFGLATPFGMESAWLRNSLVWGRPLLGMTCTDIQSVIDSLTSRHDTDMDNIRFISRNSADTAAAGLFAAALDNRIKAVDVDLKQSCFAKRNLSIVPFVLQYGDVLQWAALLADRKLIFRNIPTEAGDVNWLRSVFNAVGNAEGLSLPSP